MLLPFAVVSPLLFSYDFKPRANESNTLRNRSICLEKKNKQTKKLAWSWKILANSFSARWQLFIQRWVEICYKFMSNYVIESLALTLIKSQWNLTLGMKIVGELFAAIVTSRKTRFNSIQKGKLFVNRIVMQGNKKPQSRAPCNYNYVVCCERISSSCAARLKPVADWSRACAAVRTSAANIARQRQTLHIVSW